jgi:hypothetical protein
MIKRLNYYNSLITWNRGWYISISKKEEEEMLLIEYRIKNWINKFLKETREEWLILLEKETIEERNWRLLKEIENYLLNNK